jgi:YspA, cpYpsA-related SLOG family
VIKLLVCGGRDFSDRAFVFDCLDRADRKRPVGLIVHGACQWRDGKLRGADRWADEWAQARGITVLPFPVTPSAWARHGLRAGPMRNLHMLAATNPDAGVAFPGGSGTADMVARLQAAGVPVWLPAYPAASPNVTR